jgi:hypothetical protein
MPHPDRGHGGQALLRGSEPANRADERGHAGTADADAHQDAADEQIGGRRRRVHEVEPGDGRQHARRDDPAGAEAIDQPTGKRRSDAHDQLRECHGKAEWFAADSEVAGDRLQVESHGLGAAHRDADDDANDKNRQPQRRGFCLHNSSCGPFRGFDR